MDTPDAAPNTVAELLAGHNLSVYAAAFDDEGWDDVQQLLNISVAEFAKLVADVQMKSGHAARLRKALKLPEDSVGEAAKQSAPPPPVPPPGPPPQPPTQPMPPPHQPTLGPEAVQAQLFGKLTEQGPLGELVRGSILAPRRGMRTRACPRRSTTGRRPRAVICVRLVLWRCQRGTGTVPK